mgnify:CR=1 FL=1
MNRKFSWGALGRVQSFFFRPRRPSRALLDASWGRAVAQKVPKAFPEASGIGFGSRFGSKNDVFLMIFGVSAASFFRLVYGVDVGLFLCVFRLRAKTADVRHLQYLPHENVFF